MTKKNKWTGTDPNPVTYGQDGVPLVAPVTVQQVMNDPAWKQVFIVFLHADSNKVFAAFPGAAPSLGLLDILEELTAQYRKALREQ